MNELIEELTKQFQEGKINFGTGILFACKAQRNACARVYYDVCKNNPISPFTAVVLIKRTEIERQDYENN